MLIGVYVQSRRDAASTCTVHGAARGLFFGAFGHYTATRPEHFQNYVLFTNYQFYVSAFEIYAREQLARTDSGYTSFVATGDHEITSSDADTEQSTKTPQMPSYHLKRADGNGITLG